MTGTRGSTTDTPDPGARTLRRRFIYTVAMFVVFLIAGGVLEHDAAAPVFVAGIAGPGLAIAVVWLDGHRFFANRRLSQRQRSVVTRLAISTYAGFGGALAFAVAGLPMRPLFDVAVVLGLATAFYAGMAHMRRLSERGSDATG